jgi:hypothetical protein
MEPQEKEADKVSADKRSEAEIEASLIKNLVTNGMPQIMAPRAVSCWLALIGSHEGKNLLRMLESNEHLGNCAQYTFMQGFVAGYTAAVHHN